MRILFGLLGLSFFCVVKSGAQIYATNNVSVQTFVGSGFYGHVDGQGTQTMFYNPSSIVADSSGNFFVVDSLNYLIRKVTPDGAVTTFVGGGNASLPGYGTNVSLQYFGLNNMGIDHNDVLWICVSTSLFRVAKDGLVQGVPLAGVSSAKGICVDSHNNVYVSDSSNNKIYRLRTNLVLEVFAGSGNAGSADGNGIFTSFNGPASLAVDAADNIYVWDSFNYLVRRINQNRDVVTLAGRTNVSSNVDGTGTNVTFAGVAGMLVDPQGNLLLSVGNSYWSGSYFPGAALRRLAPDGTATTTAGSFATTGFANGSGESALFFNPAGVCLSQGKIFVADSNNHRIRVISFDAHPELVSGAELALETFPGLRINGSIGRTYRIESSPDLNNWNAEATLLLTRSPYLWIDENSMGAKKFYRALLLP